jgi:hypothetical protein
MKDQLKCKNKKRLLETKLTLTEEESNSTRGHAVLVQVREELHFND